MSSGDDLERARFKWHHPDEAGAAKGPVVFGSLAVVALTVAVAAVLFSGTTWFRPLPPEQVLLDCKQTPGICRALLPENLRNLPGERDVRGAARNRLLQGMVEAAPYRQLATQELWISELDQRAPGVRARTDEELRAWITAGVQLDERPPPLLPQEAWVPWGNDLALERARDEAQRYSRVKHALRQEHRRQLQADRAEAFAVYQRAYWGRQAGIVGVVLGLAAVVFGGLAVLLGRRREALQAFEVELTRHQLVIRDQRVPLEAMTEPDVPRVVRLLEAEGHICGHLDDFERALRERVVALQQGQVDPAARRALERLLQRTCGEQ